MSAGKHARCKTSRKDWGKYLPLNPPLPLPKAPRGAPKPFFTIAAGADVGVGVVSCSAKCVEKYNAGALVHGLHAACTRLRLGVK